MLKEQNTLKMIFAIVKIPYPQRHVRKESILDIFRNRKFLFFREFLFFNGTLGKYPSKRVLRITKVPF